MSAIFPARYPGRCLCGASFVAGARIAWDAQTRRATLCPGCAAPKAKPGTAHDMGGLSVRFDRHPVTGEIILCAVSDPTSFRAVEVFRLRDGRWYHAEFGREMVFTGPVSHETIEGWRNRFEEPMSRALAA